MLTRLAVTFSVFVFLFLLSTTAEAQIHAVSTATPQESAREAYLKREEAFTSRMNFSVQQKADYKALVEKRNTTLNSFKPGVKNFDANGKELTQKQVIIDFQQALAAMLNKEQRSKMEAERPNVIMQ